MASVTCLLSAQFATVCGKITPTAAWPKVKVSKAENYCICVLFSGCIFRARCTFNTIY